MSEQSKPNITAMDSGSKITTEALIHEIRVTTQDDFGESRGDHLRHEAGQLGLDVGQIRTSDVYYIDGITDEEAVLLAGNLADPATQDSFLVRREDWDNNVRLEVAPSPGVMNPQTEPVMKMASLIGLVPRAVQTGVEYVLPKDTLPKVIEEVARLLVNPTVEHIRTSAPNTLEVRGLREAVQTIPIRNLDDQGLVSLSKERKLALNLAEMQSVQAEARRLKRDFTDVEVEYIAAAWSEHCCHKTFNARIEEADGSVRPPLFQRIKDGSRPYFDSREVLSAFHDNSGVWRFFDSTALCIKLETHNSPMNLEPYGGSATGTGGVLRDIVATGRGARVINSQHMQFLAPLDYLQEDVPTDCYTPRYLISRSVAGVRDYGNRMGIPTNNGSFHTHPNYRGKGSILVGAMGIMPEANAIKGEPEVGDLVIAVGGKTGRDGLHGATFSSESADSDTSTLHSGAVQIGNAIEEKMVFDAIAEASEQGLVKAMTDCGAAGFASAVGEMGSDIGVTIDLANALLKYEGLSPWEIFLSESQERMVLAINPADLAALKIIFAKHGSNADVLGTFGTTDSETPKLHVLFQGNTVVDLDYNFIKNGLPGESLRAEWLPLDVPEIHPEAMDLGDIFRHVLRNGNICSKEPIVRQYDHEVGASTIMKPYGGVKGDGPNDAVVLTPILGKSYGVIEAHGCNPTLAELDPAKGSVWAYVEGMSNFVAAGGNPDDAVIVNNYISGTPTPRIMGALSKSVDALMECVEEFESPVISGKDSLSSTFKFADGTILESPYNLIITIAGKISNVENTVSTDIKKPGSTLVLIGNQDLASMGGSVYYVEAGGSSGKVPEINLKDFHETTRSLHAAIQTGQVLATHDVSEGGVAVAVAEMLFGGNCGATLDVDTPAALFNETTGCFVVEVENEAQAAELFGEINYQIIGQTYDGKELKIGANTTLDMDQLKSAYRQPFEEIFA